MLGQWSILDQPLMVGSAVQTGAGFQEKNRTVFVAKQMTAVFFVRKTQSHDWFVRDHKVHFLELKDIFAQQIHFGAKRFKYPSIPLSSIQYPPDLSPPLRCKD